MRAADTGGTPIDGTQPRPTHRPYTASSRWPGSVTAAVRACVRAEPQPLDGRHQAPLRPEPAEGAHLRSAALRGASTCARAASRRARSRRRLAAAAALPWRIPAFSASAPSSRARSRSSSRAARRSTTSTSSRSPTATRGTTWRSRCAPCSTSSTASPRTSGRSTRSAATRSSSRWRAPRCWAPAATAASSSPSSSAAPPRSSSRRPGELVDPVLIGAAMARAAERAYGSVREPAEGTILTVVREMAHRVATELAHMAAAAAAAPEPSRRRAGRAARRGAGARDRRRRGVGAARPRAAAGAARGRRRRRRRLRRWSVMFAGVSPRCAATAAPAARAPRAGARHAIPQHHSSSYRYCTNFAVTGERARRRRRGSSALEAIGDSVLVVGDAPR